MSYPYNPATDTTYPNHLVSTGEGDTKEYITYEKFVTRTVAPMGDLQSNIAHMALGVCGEGGELADAIKKSFAYKKELDIANVIEEMGDIEWYLAGMRQMLGIKRDDVLANNITKLLARYPTNEFTQEDATIRADKLPVLEVIDVTKERSVSDSDVSAMDSQAGDLR